MTFPIEESFQDAYKEISEEAKPEAEAHARLEYRDPLADFFGDSPLSRILDAEYERAYRFEFARNALHHVVGMVRRGLGGAGTVNENLD